MKSIRLSYVDSAKFLAILFVIVSHCGMSSQISHFLFAFHVPLFFILYGFVYKVQDNTDVRKYLMGGGKRLIHRVLVPYFLLSLILGDASPNGLLHICYGSIQSLAGYTSTHFWFLPCYFIAVLLFNILFITLKKHKQLIFFSIVVLSAVSAVLCGSRTVSITLFDYVIHLTGNGLSNGNVLFMGMPFAINVAFSGVAFIYIGILLRYLFDSAIVVKCLNNNYVCFIICLFTLALGYLLFLLNMGNERLIAMSLAQYGNYLLFISAATVLSVFTILLAKIIDNSFFQKYGKSTMPIYAFHLVFAIIPGVIFKLMNIPIERYPNLQAVVYGIIVMAVSCIAIPYIRKIDSNLIGE